MPESYWGGIVENDSSAQTDALSTGNNALDLHSVKLACLVWKPSDCVFTSLSIFLFDDRWSVRHRLPDCLTMSVSLSVGLGDGWGQSTRFSPLDSMAKELGSHLLQVSTGNTGNTTLILALQFTLPDYCNVLLFYGMTDDWNCCSKPNYITVCLLCFKRCFALQH